MKAIITIEQYDNGISIKWKDTEEELDDQFVVALDADKESAIGKMILDDVRCVMYKDLSNKVRMRVVYEPIKEAE